MNKEEIQRIIESGDINDFITKISLKILDEQRQHDREYARKYYIENREKIRTRVNAQLAEKIVCSCGGKFSIRNKGIHERSKRHQRHIGISC